ncbi:MAG TPA: YezD family protein [Opitutaceae bacterium]|nr:YezD family protein [Opitutaceae bacterium]
MPSEAAAAHAQQAPSEPEWLALVRDKVSDLRYGVVQVVVHDGRVTQIERTEKTRLPAEHEGRPSR